MGFDQSERAQGSIYILIWCICWKYIPVALQNEIKEKTIVTFHPNLSITAIFSPNPKDGRCGEIRLYDINYTELAVFEL